MPRRKRRAFTPEFKAEAVRLATGARRIQQGHPLLIRPLVAP